MPPERWRPPRSCNSAVFSSKQAVDYWKVGIAPKVQYPSVIHNIQSFQPNPNLELTPEEQATYCPAFAASGEHP